MEHQDARCSSQVVALAFLGGAIAGTVAGIMLAPKAGEETRRTRRSDRGVSTSWWKRGPMVKRR